MNTYDTLISFNTAKLAKEKGFNVKTKNWYDQTGVLNPTKGIRGAMVYHNFGYAPTQSLLQKWLREKHDIFLNIDLIEGKYVPTYKLTNDMSRVSTMLNIYFNTYEESLEKGLQEALKLIP